MAPTADQRLEWRHLYCDMTCFMWAWYEGVAFATILDFGRDHCIYDTQKLVSTQSIHVVWTEAYEQLWDIYIR